MIWSHSRKSENKEWYISFNVKIKTKLSGVTNKNGKGVRKNIQLRRIDSCRFTTSSLDKLASNLITSWINAKMVNISIKYIALLECKRCKTKKMKVLDEKVLKRTSTTLSGIEAVIKSFA